MNDWLDSVRDALERLVAPVRLFVRDDDGGWDDAALMRLIDRSVAWGITIDVAVIPTEVADNGALISERVNRGEMRVHQHGLAHVNREPVGRSCEFGEHRSADEIRHDLGLGRRLLRERLSCPVDPIFTPPWNRCSATTAEALHWLGYRALSRESGAEPFGLPLLAEVPVTFDWFATRKGVELTREERGRRLAEQIDGGGVVGVMLHHAVTDDEELHEIERLFAILSSCPLIERTTILAEALRQPVTT